MSLKSAPEALTPVALVTHAARIIFVHKLRRRRHPALQPTYAVRPGITTESFHRGGAFLPSLHTAHHPSPLRHVYTFDSRMRGKYLNTITALEWENEIKRERQRGRAKVCTYKKEKTLVHAMMMPLDDPSTRRVARRKGANSVFCSDIMLVTRLNFLEGRFGMEKDKCRGVTSSIGGIQMGFFFSMFRKSRWYKKFTSACSRFVIKIAWFRLTENTLKFSVSRSE